MSKKEKVGECVECSIMIDGRRVVITPYDPDEYDNTWWFCGIPVKMIPLKKLQQWIEEKQWAKT